MFTCYTDLYLLTQCSMTRESNGDGAETEMNSSVIPDGESCCVCFALQLCLVYISTTCVACAAKWRPFSKLRQHELIWLAFEELGQPENLSRTMISSKLVEWGLKPLDSHDGRFNTEMTGTAKTLANPKMMKKAWVAVWDNVERNTGKRVLNAKGKACSRSSWRLSWTTTPPAPST